MKVCGLLCWFDESPHWLATAVAGFARVCDTIIAVDGAYALYPGGRARSHPQQAEAIMLAAEAAGAGCVIHRPETVFFGNEVEKRNQALSLAGALLTPGEDWVFVFDADYHFLQANVDAVRAGLETTDLDVASMSLLDGQDMLATDALAAFAKTHSVDTEWASRDRALFRWTPSLRYGPSHWCLSGEYDGERRWVRGPYEDIVDAHDFGGALVVYHRNTDRTLVRRNAAAGYYRNRAAAGIEQPDPVSA